MKCVIGIDTGTTHLKAALIGLDGKVQFIDKVPTPLCVCGNESWYEPEQIYETVKRQIQGLVLKADRGSMEVCAICLTGMAEAGLVVDRSTGRELTEILPWFDKRTEELSKQLEEDMIRRQYQKTGLYNSFKYGIYKYIWLLENRKLDKESAIWLSLSDYLAFRLTGIYATTPGFAVRTYVYDMIYDCWNMEMLDRYGLQAENFPAVRKEGQAVGLCVDSELCTILGSHVEVAISGHDHVCALYAIAGEDSLRIVDSCGTAETYMGITEKYLLTDADYKNGLVYGPYPGEDRWFWMGNIPSSGQSVEQFRKQLHAGKECESALTYEEMELMLKEIQKEPTGLFYFPYLNGVGTPVYRGDIKEQLLGKRENQSAGVMLKAIIEGIQYQGTWIMECAKNHRMNKEIQLWCVGGATKSSEWMKLKADILGIPVHVPWQEEATLLGAAAIYLRENGKKVSPNKAAENCEKEVKVYLPDNESKTEYCKLAEEYRHKAKQICGVEDIRTE